MRRKTELRWTWELYLLLVTTLCPPVAWYYVGFALFAKNAPGSLARMSSGILAFLVLTILYMMLCTHKQLSTWYIFIFATWFCVPFGLWIAWGKVFLKRTLKRSVR